MASPASSQPLTDDGIRQTKAANDKLAAKWMALCAREDDVSTELIVEAVDISERQISTLLRNLWLRCVRDYDSYGDDGLKKAEEERKDSMDGVTLRSQLDFFGRGSWSSDSSSDSDDSEDGSVKGPKSDSGASSDFWAGGFKPWNKPGLTKAIDKADEWGFDRTSERK